MNAREALRDAYMREVGALADEYRERICAGEFSGDATPGGDPAWLRLRDELERHQWARSERETQLVRAISPWFDRSLRRRLSPGYEDAADCLTRDVLGVAIERGWLQRGRRNDGEPAPARRAEARRCA